MTNHRGHSDERLVKELAENASQVALGELFERYHYLVLGVCLKYMKDESLAEDIAAELFERLPVMVRKQPIQYFRSWLYTCARNACLMHLRKKKMEVSYGGFSDFDGPIEGLEKNESQLPLIPCLESLPVEQRKCVELFYFEKKSYAEVAKETGFVLKKVKSYLQNGRRQLKKCLNRSRSNEG